MASKSDLHRNVADYKPSVWGDYFLRYASESMVRKHLEINIWYTNIYYISILRAFLLCFDHACNIEP